MGKKKSKKVDVEKKAALQAKKDAKQDKAARKRLQKDASTSIGDAGEGSTAAEEGVHQQVHFEALLEQYKKADQTAVTAAAVDGAAYIETLDSFPLARANATWTLYDDDTKKKKRNAEIYMFGGEYYDGVENIILNHLLKYEVSKREWKRIHPPPAHACWPPARCAHSTVYYNHALYVFGGELATVDEYHHYKDLWRFDLKAQSWQEIKSNSSASASSTTLQESSSSKKKNTASTAASAGTVTNNTGLMMTATGIPPSARSGHVAVVWKHYMIIFGGFYEAMRDTPRWYNDVSVMNLKTLEWLFVPHSKLSVRPEPRSACNADVIGDDLIIHGGFSKLVNNNRASLSQPSSTSVLASSALSSETRVHSDAWMLHLKPLLSDKPPTWERLTSSSRGGTTTSTATDRLSPNGRAGTSSVAYKNRLLAYGGVIDHEAHHHKVNSIFYNDLFCLDIDRRKWFPIHATKTNTTSTATTTSRQAHHQPDDDKDKKAADDLSSRADEDVEKDSHDDGNDEDDDEDDDFLEVDDNNPIDNDASKAEQHQGWDLEKLRTNMFAFIDGDGHVIYEKFVDSDDDDDHGHTGKKMPPDSDSDEEEKDEEKEETKEEDDDEEEEEEEEKDDAEERSLAARNKKKQSQRHNDHHNAKVVTSSSVMALNPETNIPEAVVRSEPLPRINSSLVVVNGHTLLVYGGLVEVGDREVTLDDLWSLDLRKREQWECIWPGTMHKQVWRGAMHNDDDSYYSSSDKPSLLGDDDDDDDDDNEALDNAPHVAGKSKIKSADVQELIAQLNEQYDLTDRDQTPEPGEALAEFYSRTSNYWNEKAAATLAAAGGVGGEEATSNKKEIKREGFGLAKKRYEDLEPIMKQLSELDMSSSAKKEKSGSKEQSERKEKKDKDSRKGGRRR